MKCDSWASFLAHTFASLCLGHEPKAKVATTMTNLVKQIASYEKLGNTNTN
jgi:hypothetical protein